MAVRAILAAIGLGAIIAIARWYFADMYVTRDQLTQEIWLRGAVVVASPKLTRNDPPTHAIFGINTILLKNPIIVHGMPPLGRTATIVIGEDRSFAEQVFVEIDKMKKVSFQYPNVPFPSMEGIPTTIRIIKIEADGSPTVLDAAEIGYIDVRLH